MATTTLTLSEKVTRLVSALGFMKDKYTLEKTEWLILSRESISMRDTRVMNEQSEELGLFFCINGSSEKRLLEVWFGHK